MVVQCLSRACRARAETLPVHDPAGGHVQPDNFVRWSRAAGAIVGRVQTERVF